MDIIGKIVFAIVILGLAVGDLIIWRMVYNDIISYNRDLIFDGIIFGVMILCLLLFTINMVKDYY